MLLININCAFNVDVAPFTAFFEQNLLKMYPFFNKKLFKIDMYEK